MDTPNLGLPFLLAAQAQKHVTHNEALRALDALVHLAVIDRDATTPPGSPAEGDRYIVAAGGAEAWDGHDLEIAAYQDGAWAFFVPVPGWRSWIGDEELLVVWDGSAWSPVGGGGGSGGDGEFDTVGINASADETNKLAIASAASLFNHAGNGHQQKINKAAAGDTASVLYQTGFSGRAEMGTTGDDDFHFKVSPDGSAWNEAILIDKDTGEVSFPSGVDLEGSGIDDLVEDETPQLGGDLDLNGNDIEGTGNIDIAGTVKATAGGSPDILYAFDAVALTSGAGEMSALNALHALANHAGSGALAFAAGINTRVMLSGAGDVVNVYGIVINEVLEEAAGEVTGAIVGLSISDQTQAPHGTVKWNLHSIGENSNNVFDGVLQLNKLGASEIVALNEFKQTVGIAPVDLLRPAVNAQTGTSYTLVLADQGRIATMSNGSANVLTIPANAAVAFPVGTIINVLQIGAGVTTIEGDTGVAVNGVSAGEGEINNRYQGVALTKIATDTWIASGDISEVA
jgi:hypothetical protein